MLCIANGRVCCSLKQHMEVNLGRKFRSTTHFYGEDAQPFFDSLSRRHGGGHQRSCPSFQGFFQSRELSKCPALFGFFRHNTPKNTHTAQYDVPALSPHYTARPSQLIPTRPQMQLSVCLRKPVAKPLKGVPSIVFVFFILKRAARASISKSFCQKSSQNKHGRVEIRGRAKYVWSD